MRFIHFLYFTLYCTLISQAQYTDLPANITWTGPNISLGTATVDEIETAYNHARTEENTALSTNLPSIDFPASAIWQTMNIQEKALWIINSERVDRGIQPLEGTATEVTEIAQTYCKYLIDNETTGHYADGHNPLYRLQQNAKINACLEAYSENIGYSYSNNTVAPTFVVERLIYWLIYEDASANWGHRQNFFLSNFNDNSGETGKEGLLGVGYVVSTSYTTYIYTAFVVFNIIDPCATWDFSVTEITKPFPENYLFVKDSQLTITNIPKESRIELFTNNGKRVLQVISQSDSYTSSGLKPNSYLIRIHYPNNTIYTSNFTIFK